MNLIIFYLIFITQFTYINFFIIKIENQDVALVTRGLLNLAEDLSKLGFQSNLSISITFISILISIANTIFLFVYKFKIKKNTINIFFVNTGVTFFVIYLFRFYNFSRFYLILDIVIYPFYTLAFLYLINFEFKKNKLSILFKLIFINFLFIFIILNQFDIGSTKLEINSEDSTQSSENQTSVKLNLNIDTNLNCYKWSGSSNFSNCISAIEVKEIYSKIDSAQKINNFVYFKNKLYIVFGTGQIRTFDEEGIFTEYFNISSLVRGEVAEAGLYDIEFHPLEDYFIVSFTNRKNELTIAKVNGINNPKIENLETLLTVPNDTDNHYCGSIEWSNIFNDFLICIGDMGNPQNSINTSTIKGKILTLNSNKLVGETKLISDSANNNVLDNLVAFGLRNPWNFKEFENYLIIPDVGEKNNEELNIVNLDNLISTKSSIPFFGWPIYEGSLDNKVKFFSSKIWESSEIETKDYLKSISIPPIVYYDRPAPENVRAAILGTVLFDELDSNYFGSVIFSDYISKEIFVYDITNDELNIVNLPFIPGYLTAISTNPFERDSILISTVDEGGMKILSIRLP